MSKPIFTWSVRVYYEDTDASGVVYHANYLKYFERARTEWLRALGVSQQNLRGVKDVVFTVANLEIDFLRPARLDDALTVTVVIEQLRRASLMFSQTLSRDTEPDSPLSKARVRVGCVDMENFKPCPLPDVFSEYLATHGVSA